MKIKFLSFLFIVSLSYPTFAMAIFPKPKSCPSVSAIKAVGIQKVSPNLGWMGYSKSRYDTLEEWDFILLMIFADSAKSAIEQGNKNLTLLILNSGPFQERNEEEAPWICSYSYPGEDSTAFASTPPEQ